MTTQLIARPAIAGNEIPTGALLFPDKLQFLFRPSRYKVAYGGRGSSKSWSFARALLIEAMQKPCRILCARELQNSIAESVHHLLSNQIVRMGLTPWFRVQQQSIIARNGSVFFFEGVKSNPTKIKSAEGITHVWIEEAEKVSAQSWELLIPTIRTPGSEIWVSFNPDLASDPTYQRFVVNPPPDAVSREINWTDNPWFPSELRREKDYLYRVDPDAAACVWGGSCRTNSSTQVLRNKYVVEEFKVPIEGPRWDGPYFGADWGFSVDPTVLVKCWIDSEQRRLMVEHEAYGIGVELDEIPAMFDQIPGARQYVLRADCSRPDTIAFIKSRGFLIEGAEKRPGSIESGVEFLRSFTQIVIHPRCRHMQEEARLYSYKTDRLSGDPLPEILDRHNHVIDSLRYALQPMITANDSLAVWERLGELP